MMTHKNDEERARMMRLLQAFSPDHYDRYEIYRRAKLGKAVVKRLLYHQTGVHVNDKVALAISASAKVFVGEIIETALDYRDQRKLASPDDHTQDGPLKPKHIREALRRLREEPNNVWPILG